MWRALRRFSTKGIQREQMEVDVAIVGGGPSGLAAAIRLKQLLPDIEVCLLEKGAEIGAHILSGNVFEPRALDELIPDWRDLDTPVRTKVSKDSIRIFTEKSSYEIPSMLVPKPLHNEGNYIISLSDTCRWLGDYAENLGVMIFPSNPAADYILSEEGFIEGVITGDMGIGKDGNPKENFQPGIEIRAKQTIFSEGCRGSLTERLIQHFKLRDFYDGERKIVPQTYGIGVKEIWKVKPENFTKGYVLHSLAWPLDSSILGGGFMYHEREDQVHVGLVLALDYKNPHLNPYKEFQRYKTHPFIRKVLEGGEPLAYGGRAVNEGGFYAVPKLTFPGGMLAGDCAGFLNTAKIKGTHNCMKTGMLAAEAIAEATEQGDIAGKELEGYYSKFRNSWVWDDLYEVRNFREGFSRGIWFGQAHAFVSYNILGGRGLGGKKPQHIEDWETTGYASEHKPIEYPKPDGKLTFDLNTNLQRANVNHEHDQPSHLVIRNGMESKPTEFSHKLFDGPEQRFCPAGVYEFHEGKLQINAQNCIHCKTCDIKTPGGYIQWTTPEGGGGPFYKGM